MIPTILALVALQLADGGLTWYGMTRLGMREANGPLAWAMDRVGVIPALVAAKGAAAFLSIYAALYHPIAAFVLVAIYAAVVVINFTRIRERLK